MPLSSLPPLDLLTEHLGPNQHPSALLLLIVALIASGGLLASWALHDEVPGSDAVPGRLEATATGMNTTGAMLRWSWPSR